MHVESLKMDEYWQSYYTKVKVWFFEFWVLPGILQIAVMGFLILKVYLGHLFHIAYASGYFSQHSPEPSSQLWIWSLVSHTDTQPDVSTGSQPLKWSGHALEHVQLLAKLFIQSGWKWPVYHISICRYTYLAPCHDPLHNWHQLILTLTWQCLTATRTMTPWQTPERKKGPSLISINNYHMLSKKWGVVTQTLLCFDD